MEITLNEQLFLLADGELCSPPLLLRERLDTIVTREHFEENYTLLLRRLDDLKKKRGLVTPQEEKEVTFMLEVIIAMKNLLTEEK